MKKNINAILEEIKADLDRKLADATTDEAKQSAKDMAVRLTLIFSAAAVHAESKSFLGRLRRMAGKQHTMASMMRMPGETVPTDEDWEWCLKVNKAIKADEPLPAHPDPDIQNFLATAKLKFE